jgi:hypothetical protein
MHKRARAFLLTALGGLTTLGLCLALANSGKSARLPITLDCWGQYSPTHMVFGASVTNASRRTIVVGEILFEWKERCGDIRKINVFGGAQVRLPPGSATISCCCIPLDAEKIRAATIDDGGGYFQRVVLWLHLDRYPRVCAWLGRIGLLPPNGASGYTHRGPWMANPLRGANKGQPPS